MESKTFSFERLWIVTNIGDFINEKVKINWKDQSFSVWVYEEDVDWLPDLTEVTAGVAEQEGVQSVNEDVGSRTDSRSANVQVECSGSEGVSGRKAKSVHGDGRGTAHASSLGGGSKTRSDKEIGVGPGSRCIRRNYRSNRAESNGADSDPFGIGLLWGEVGPRPRKRPRNQVKHDFELEELAQQGNNLDLNRSASGGTSSGKVTTVFRTEWG
ncbi:hypothetical protein SSX86_003758 [Deinandra increscens subsp. villosa]|uniref:Uncharacterized protein n=1 Tax=Deinandra increscens subsp. villosa TaxID=3103831 RepID=A0AAP0HA91_9ASTR